MLEYIPYVLLFMLATMLIYGWGLYRSSHAAMDDTKLLYSKAASKVCNALNKKPMTRKEIKAQIEGLEASRPFSRRRVAVTDAEVFTTQLLTILENEKKIAKTTEKGVIYYSLADKS